MFGGVRAPGDEPELDAFSPRQSDVALAFSRDENSREAFLFKRSDVDHFGFGRRTRNSSAPDTAYGKTSPRMQVVCRGEN